MSNKQTGLNYPKALRAPIAQVMTGADGRSDPADLERWRKEHVHRLMGLLIFHRIEVPDGDIEKAMRILLVRLVHAHVLDTPRGKPGRKRLDTERELPRAELVTVFETLKAENPSLASDEAAARWLSLSTHVGRLPAYYGKLPRRLGYKGLLAELAKGRETARWEERQRQVEEDFGDFLFSHD